MQEVTHDSISGVIDDHNAREIKRERCKDRGFQLPVCNNKWKAIVPTVELDKFIGCMFVYEDNFYTLLPDEDGCLFPYKFMTDGIMEKVEPDGKNAVSYLKYITTQLPDMFHVNNTFDVGDEVYRGFDLTVMYKASDSLSHRKGYDYSTFKATQCMENTDSSILLIAGNICTVTESYGDNTYGISYGSIHQSFQVQSGLIGKRLESIPFH